ncbi:DUF1768-domain-containing protein [Teratosphaeria nubilosa]|uniref:DUF1768-domain-containing protein n=1 Tax=Teratosphaeria nubilosa TaxID=161662 RepID=A0A6G1L214_9PEZI|nr:DUF1768-domain-containing protein [Teratosphaeria nubilosa]
MARKRKTKAPVIARSHATASTTSKPDDSSHTQASTGTVYFHSPDKPFGFLSQWYMSHFTDPSIHPTHSFNCAEQYMMYRKALLIASSSPKYQHQDLPDKILRHSKPAQQKILAVPGTVKMTEEQREAWDEVKYGVVVRGNWLKFRQRGVLRERLLATGDRELAEASLSDGGWGHWLYGAFCGAESGEVGAEFVGEGVDGGEGED